MKKRKGNSLRKIMAGLISAVMIAGMVSGAAPVDAYAEENAETDDMAGSSPIDETESETAGTETAGAETAGTETSEAGKTETGNAGDLITEPGQTTDITGELSEEDETVLVEEETAPMEENLADDVVLLEEHSHDGIAYTAWTSTDSLPEAEGNYYLTQNVTITERWLVKEGTIKLCLNGKTITMGNHTFGERIVIISEDGELALYDCVGSGKMTGADDSCVYNRGTFYMFGGEISGNSNSKSLNPSLSGGGVNNGGTFYMYGGRIKDNRNSESASAGGVYNKSNAAFYMYGGEITNNDARGVCNWGTFYLYDGKIENNRAGIEGGSGVKNNNLFYMYGGKIVNNTSTSGAGGGVSHASFSGGFYMYGGEISGNVSPYGGGGVMAYSPIYVYGGKISGNRVEYSGSGSAGVYFGALSSGTGEQQAYGRLTVGGSAVISGNKDASGIESNVGVSHTNTIVIDDEKPLSGSADIGITVFSGYRPTEGNPRRVTDANAADYSAYLHSDNPDYIVQKGADNAVFIAVPSPHTHQWADTWNNNATHHWHNCTAIGCTITDNAAKDGYAVHTEDGGSVTKEPTETEAGIRTYKCNICGYVVRTETIPATGTGGDKPNDGNDDKPNNGGGEEKPDDNNKPNDNPPENNNDGGNNNVSDNHDIANTDSESVDVSENVSDTDIETPVMIPEQPRDSEPKTADATPVELYATLAMISGLTYVILYFADRNGGMTEETKKELVSKLIRWAKRGKTIRRLLALSAIFVLLVYYHSIGKQGSIEWKEAC